MKLSPHFNLWEAARSDIADRHGIDNTPPQHLHDNLEQIAQTILEPIRQNFQTPFSPTSWYRCAKLNTLIKGSQNSQHIQGQAVDIVLPTVPSRTLALWIKNNITQFDQLILEYHNPKQNQSGWVHCSIATKPRQQAFILTHDHNNLPL